MKDRRITGWRLSGEERARLLARWPARYERAVADHVTLDPDAGDAPPPPGVAARIVGRADDGRGVEALVAEIDGRTARPGGGVFHITWSLAPGRRAAESNEVIARLGWTAVEAEAVTLIPADLGRG